MNQKIIWRKTFALIFSLSSLEKYKIGQKVKKILINSDWIVTTFLCLDKFKTRRNFLEVKLAQKKKGENDPAYSYKQG